MARPYCVPALHCGLIAALLVFGEGRAAQAQDVGAVGGAHDYPIPATAREAYSPIGEGFASPIEPRENLQGPSPYVDERGPWLSSLSRGLQDEGPFLRDTSLKLNSRSYWLPQDVFGFKAEALTSGGSLAYQSGFIADFLQLRGVLYTSQPLYAPDGAGATFNLAPDGDQITTLGQANARFRAAGHELTAGRQLVRTPYLNPNDFRMIPLTFEGVMLLPEDRQERNLNYVASYLWRYKPHEREQFIPFSEALGVRQDEGVLITGARYRTADWNYGLVNYWIDDLMNTAYGEIDYTLPFGGVDGAPSFRLSVNHADQRSVGEELMPGAPFHTFQASARLVASYRSFVLTGAVSQVGDGAIFRHPFGTSAAFTAMMTTSFQRAGELGHIVSLSYDFSRLGIDGMKFVVGYGRGVDAIDARTSATLPDRDEYNLRLEYEPHGGTLQGLRVQIEYADQRLDRARPPRDDFTQFRAIVNYAIPLL
ncbi:MAG: OprD family outer membrane porin, partial [Methyloceanibacter sp.]